MRLVLFLVLLALPLVELALLIKLGQWIGLWPTVGIVIGTALLGAAVMHRQGLNTLRRAVDMSAQGAPPLEPVIEGMFLLLAGALLLAPGLLTDFVGIALLVPPLRRMIAQRAFAGLMRRATVEVHTSRWSRARRGPQTTSGDRYTDARNDTVIEGEFQRIDESETPSPDRKPQS